jgi:hypothetical protein
MYALAEIRVGLGNLLIDPELDPGNPGFGRLQQVCENSRVAAKDVVGESQPVPERNCEVHIPGRGVTGVACVVSAVGGHAKRDDEGQRRGERLAAGGPSP